MRMPTFLSRVFKLGPTLAATAHLSDLIDMKREREAIRTTNPAAPRQRPARAADTPPPDAEIAAARQRAAQAAHIHTQGKCALASRYDMAVGRVGAADELLRREAGAQIERLRADAALNHADNPRIYDSWISRLTRDGFHDERAIEVLSRALAEKTVKAAPTAPAAPTVATPPTAAPVAAQRIPVADGIASQTPFADKLEQLRADGNPYAIADHYHKNKAALKAEFWHARAEHQKRQDKDRKARTLVHPCNPTAKNH